MRIIQHVTGYDAFIKVVGVIMADNDQIDAVERRSCLLHLPDNITGWGIAPVSPDGIEHSIDRYFFSAGFDEETFVGNIGNPAFIL
jgi:hypothetical protein